MKNYTLEETKKEIESKYHVRLYARTIDGTKILTSYGKPFIEIRWSDHVAGFDVICTETMTSKEHLFSTGYKDRWSLDRIINEMKPYFSPTPIKQMSLF